MLGISQEELAVSAGVSAQTVINFEMEKHVPREDTLMRIQAALEERGCIFANGNRPTVTIDLSRAKPHVR